MSAATNTQAHINYELIDDENPEAVLIGFLSPEIAGPQLARELGEQLNSLIRPDLPRNFVIDFGNVRSLGSTAFGEIADFVRRVGRVRVCNLDNTLLLGATLIGLDDWVQFADSRGAAIRAARRDWRRGDEDTVDHPGSEA
jgi:anti-anti-sigma regulatory factor